MVVSRPVHFPPQVFSEQGRFASSRFAQIYNNGKLTLN